MLKPAWRDLVLPTWKIAFAIVATLDIIICWSVLLDGWHDSGSKEQEQSTHHKEITFYQYFHNHVKQEEEALNQTSTTCPVSDSYGGYYQIFAALVLKRSTIGVLFCCLCLLEAFRKAKEARQVAFENAALDNFEKKLARLYSTTRCNVFRQQPGEEDYESSQIDLELARNTLRVWTPVATTLTLWFILLPWTNFFGAFCIFGDDNKDDAECLVGNLDTSLATIWITNSLTQFNEGFQFLESKFYSVAWDIILPYSMLYHPKRLYKRIKQILRWLRHIRYSGPLARLFLKLNDQLIVFVKTYFQSRKAKSEKEKRVSRRSILFDDIRKIESFTKVQTALASIPSQLFNLVQQDQSATTEVSAGIQRLAKKKKEEGQKLRKRFNFLKAEIRNNSSIFPSSKVYDEIVELNQELKTVLSTAIFSSHLISPQTRFSVGWRLIVTFALLSELCRLYCSWQLSGTFEVSLSSMIRSLFVQCDEQMMERFRFITRRGKSIRRYIGKLLRLPNIEELKHCMPTSTSSSIFVHMGTALESTINIVCFLDIFVWFFTGELDAKGVVVPKSFFTRCILPGTLVQVLDHPTLPEKLPQLISDFMNAVEAVGYSRVIRWALAIYPAFEMLVVDPLKLYLFRPMGDDEFLKYTESFALFPTFSSASIRNTGNGKSNLLSHPSGMLSYPSVGKISSSTFSYPSTSTDMDKEDSFSLTYSLHY